MVEDFITFLYVFMSVVTFFVRPPSLFQRRILGVVQIVSPSSEEN